MADFISELERLEALRLKGTLTEEEFQAAKLKLLAPASSDAALTTVETTPWGISRKAVLGVATLVALLLVAGGGYWAYGSVTASSTYPLKGSLTTPSCGGGYGAENATVEVRDQSNNLVASTTTSSNDKTVTGKCHVVFAAVVPKAKFYQFKVGTHGAPDYTFAQMQGNNWHLDLTMGS